MLELLNNRFFVIGVAVIGCAIIYHFISKKDKPSSDLEMEYTEVLNSNKYKVKSQYEN